MEQASRMSFSQSPPVWGPLVDFDRRRTREFYRYYEPFSTLFVERPSFVDLHDGYAVEQHKPCASPDKALTALCQLVAVQLRARRAMLFFFDEHYGYILAESTKSLSLQSNNPYVPGDTLWLGFSVIPKGFSVCEHTSRIPFGEMLNVPSAKKGLHIINDLRNDARFSNRPYVTGSPRARFYAGAPIITPQGVPIGALCALDHEPRNGLSDVDAEFLQDMAATIMQHFEAMRTRAEYKRGTHMIAGLSAFVRGINSDQSQHNSDYANAMASNPVPDGDASLPPGRSQNTAVLDWAEVRRTEDSQTSRSQGGTADSQEEFTTVNADRRAELFPLKDSNVEEKTPQQEAQYPYVLASSLVRKALDVDGMLFLDAAINTFGGLVHGPRRVSLNDDSAESMTMSEKEPMSRQSAIRTEKGETAGTIACPVLAAAYDGGVDTDLRPLSQSRLRSLCRRYPRGKIWVFDSRRDLATSGRSSEAGATSEGSMTDDASTKRRKSRHVRQEEEAEYIAKCIPGVRSLIFMPLRDHTTGLWRAGAVVYTRSMTRTFSQEGELSFLAAFCDVVVAELARAETQATFDAKTNFMSSISHELRTPLHGILGTSEQLHEELSQGLAARMLNQIEVCGRTLLDVVDHLLDFTALNQNLKGHDPYATHTETLHGYDGGYDKSVTANTGQDAVVTLDELTEEVVESSVVAFSSNYGGQRQHSSTATTIFRVEQSGVSDWRCRISRGAWKRVCLNLVTNAKKYTSTGHILVTLRQESAGLVQPQQYAVFSVEDTGRGMSESFMVNSLFRPFKQENALAPGAGLGMSIVAQLVRSMGGNIDVRSHQGEGTAVIVRVPLLRSMSHASSDTPWLARSPFNQAGKLGIAKLLNEQITDPATHDKELHGRHLLLSAVTQSLTSLGIRVVATQSLTNRVDFLLAFEEESLSATLAKLKYAIPSTERMAPVLIICNDYASAQIAQARQAAHSTLSSSNIQYIPQPCGPVRLLEAIEACLTGDTPARASPIRDGADSERQRKRRAVSLDSSMPDILRNANREPPNRERGLNPRVSIERLGLQDYPHKTSKFIPFDAQDAGSSTSLGRNNSKPFPSLPSSVHVQGKLATLTPGTKSSSSEQLELMLVDDNHINIQLLSTYCKKRGYRSRVATDGLQAVNMYRDAVLGSRSEITSSTDENNPVTHMATVPQVILLDINMPVMDGFEAACSIRAFEKASSVKPPVRIFAMTGLHSSEARQRAFACGIDQFFSKPVKLKELTNALQQIPIDRVV